MKYIIEDISNLTGVPEHVLEKFLPTIINVIGHMIHESQCEQKDTTEIDLGFGELHIRTNSTGIQYRFVPSKDLEKTLVNTVVTNTSPILTKLECNLQQKIEKAYKEIL